MSAFDSYDPDFDDYPWDPAYDGSPGPGEFCHRHFSWLCQAGQGVCQQDQPDPTSPAARRDDHNPRTRGPVAGTAATRKAPPS